MTHKTQRRNAAGILLAALALLAAGLPAGSAAPVELDRDDDPVIAVGGQMPAFNGVPLHDLLAYKHTGGVWHQIPWQFDEVADGRLTPLEDGILDADDQLVFLSRDAGGFAGSDTWISNPDSRRYPRYQIAVTDPLNPAKQGWVYVYRSATLSETSATDYVNYSAATWQFTAQRYILRTIPYRLPAERLEMNGSGVDVLDRTKMRVQFAGIPTMLTEDGIELNDTPVIKDGKVRAFVTLSGPAGAEVTLIGYRASFDIAYRLDFTGQMHPVGWMRMSADFSAAATDSTYYDANVSAGVPVDGAPDSVPTTLPTDWWQVSGSAGTVVQVADMSWLGGTRSNYYKDNKTLDPSDTGDQASYSDCGARVDSPNADMRFHLYYYTLPANQPNLGAIYRDRALSPLIATASAQPYGQWRVRLPVVMSGN